MPDPITRLPIWRLDGPLVAAGQTVVAVAAADTGTCIDAASVVVLPAAGFFASQLDDLPAPYDRDRPYLWHRGYLLSPGAGSGGTGPSAQAELAGGADTAINVLLDSLATETGTGADAGTNVLLSAAAETGAGADVGTNILLATALETGTGTDAGTNVLLDGLTTETATALDDASVVQLSQQPVGFFASQGIVVGEGNEIPGPNYRQRPYWRYRAPLLSADSGGQPVAISASDSAGATDAAVNLLLSGADDPATATDASSNILLALAADASAGTDSAANILLSAADAGSGVDAAGNLLLSGAEIAAGADLAIGILLAGPGDIGSGIDVGVILIISGAIAVGFFASQGAVPGEGNELPGPLYRQRPYWRYHGPLLSSPPGVASTIQDVSIRTGPLQSAWIMTPQGPRWVIIFDKMNTDWSLKTAQVEANA